MIAADACGTTSPFSLLRLMVKANRTAEACRTSWRSPSSHEFTCHGSSN